MLMRSHFCGTINEACLGQTVSVCGWVQTRRDHGGVIFMDLRDKSGVLQLVADHTDNAAVFAVAEEVRNEYVLRAEGVVRPRPAGTENDGLATGRVEMTVSNLRILNAAVALPFAPGEDDVSEEVRLRHRVLDLRGEPMQRRLRLRHTAAVAARHWLDDNDFCEIETPLLTAPTPEGARDFLVPSRLQNGAFYALPQSPQLFKQMLMAAGYERYYQIARCFRDEDLRADRQPEFTQIDVEMSFVAEKDVMDAMEEMTAAIFAAANRPFPTPVPRLSFAESMQRYGCDRPDLRNPLELIDIDDIMREAEFKVFSQPAQDDEGRVAVLRLPAGADLSRKEIDALTEFVRHYGAAGLAYIKVVNVDAGAEGLQSPIVKFLSADNITALLTKSKAANGDMLFFRAGRADIVNASLAALRDKLAQMRNLLVGEFLPVWIVDFPMFEYDYDSRSWLARHHPFTAPRSEDEEKLSENPGQAIACAYDLVVNGVEIGGGSIRIHRVQTQLAALAVLGINEKKTREDFGFLLAALELGAPPHGGIAFGFDRICAMLAGVNSIREVIAFPKTQRGQCLVTNAPRNAVQEQWRELGLRLSDDKRDS
ncbi:MAG: aspartate--tRNA ligase [Candidatus Zeuxoniibacter abyssi]|nr:MAG: aspartate--tRNA ligase [Candidatus Persebacteraceae bacterium AB1(2)]